MKKRSFHRFVTTLNKSCYLQFMEVPSAGKFIFSTVSSERIEKIVFNYCANHPRPQRFLSYKKVKKRWERGCALTLGKFC